MRRAELGMIWSQRHAGRVVFRDRRESPVTEGPTEALFEISVRKGRTGSRLEPGQCAKEKSIS